MNFNSVRLGFVVIAFAVTSNGLMSDAVYAAEFSFTAMTKKYSRGDGLETSRRITEARKANRASATAVKQ